MLSKPKTSRVKTISTTDGKLGSNSKVLTTGPKWVLYRELSPACVAYTGGIRTKDDLREIDLHTVVALSDGNLASDSSGNIFAVYTSNPNAPSGGLGPVAGWSNLASSFDEYRTLMIEIKYVPYDKFNRGVSVFTAPIMCVTDYDSAVALTSYAQADAYSSSKTFSLDQSWTYVVRMNGIENSNFTSTLSPAPFFYMKTCCTGVTVSTSYGKIFVRYRIQFRGRGL